jgi:hypothetical protein
VPPRGGAMEIESAGRGLQRFRPQCHVRRSRQRRLFRGLYSSFRATGEPLGIQSRDYNCRTEFAGSSIVSYHPHVFETLAYELKGRATRRVFRPSRRTYTSCQLCKERACVADYQKPIYRQLFSYYFPVHLLRRRFDLLCHTAALARTRP